MLDLLQPEIFIKYYVTSKTEKDGIYFSKEARRYLLGNIGKVGAG
ncbi:hypothetical protein BLGI_2323 [Brevibacillus laterosporus GI-9]|nr:hypothetical protein BLGI_2323 [Brevibacillus laterosporus GI-9]